MIVILCFLSIVHSSLSDHYFDARKVIYAINAGSTQKHIDSLGIKYDADPLYNFEAKKDTIGISSHYGEKLTIRRVPEADRKLYEIERYHTSTFGYDIPISEDGDYVLVLKFCEVYFSTKSSKVFDVALNGMKVIENLDIYSKVGKGVAHDEYVQFSIKDNVFVYNNMESFINNGKIRVEFIKGRKDNPKINAIIVYKGTVDEFPKLPPLNTKSVPVEEKITVEPKETTTKPPKPIKVSTTTKTQPIRDGPDPYATEQPTMMWQVCVLMVVIFGVFYTFCRI